ncbi:MAG: DUF1640 domain-containing protein [Alphaproteobacteria bacterium]|nr:DUF1640 domain-containing protein [Alphaproteobacteria bacterium]
MSEAIAFDTHRYVKRLTRGGFTEEQAKALVDVQVAMFDANLATKADIENVRAEIAAAKADVFKWMIGLALIAQASLVVALVKLLQ